MGKQMIENSDRGITLAKPLAWTILVAMVSGGFWVGVQVTRAEGNILILTERQNEDRNAIRANTADISSLRQTGERVDQRLLNIEQTTRRTEDAMTELLRYIRNPD